MDEKQTINTDYIEKKFKRFLGFHYGNRKSLLEQLQKGLKKYQNAPNQSHPRTIARILTYQKLIARLQELRSVRVTYSDDSQITTSMNSMLSDSEIHEYFSVGKVFNIGNVSDNLQKVERCEILS